MTSDHWTREKVGRIGDMHPRKALDVCQNADGDIVISITMNGMPLGDVFGEENAVVEFCSSSGGGGRSVHTAAALLDLMEAMKKDNEERPDANPEKERNVP